MTFAPNSFASWTAKARDPADVAVDEHRVSRDLAQPALDGVQRGQAGGGQAGRGDRIQRRWDDGQCLRRHGDVLGEPARLAHVVVEDDAVARGGQHPADLATRRGVGVHRHDPAGDVRARDVGIAPGRVAGLGAGAVDGVEPDGLHPDEHLDVAACSGLAAPRARDLRQPKGRRWAGSVHHPGTHPDSIPSPTPPMCRARLAPGPQASSIPTMVNTAA